MGFKINHELDYLNIPEKRNYRIAKTLLYDLKEHYRFFQNGKKYKWYSIFLDVLRYNFYLIPLVRFHVKYYRDKNGRRKFNSSLKTITKVMWQEMEKYYHPDKSLRKGRYRKSYVIRGEIDLPSELSENLKEDGEDYIDKDVFSRTKFVLGSMISVYHNKKMLEYYHSVKKYREQEFYNSYFFYKLKLFFAVLPPLRYLAILFTFPLRKHREGLLNRFFQSIGNRFDDIIVSSILHFRDKKVELEEKQKQLRENAIMIHNFRPSFDNWRARIKNAEESYK